MFCKHFMTKNRSNFVRCDLQNHSITRNRNGMLPSNKYDLFPLFASVFVVTATTFAESFFKSLILLIEIFYFQQTEKFFGKMLNFISDELNEIVSRKLFTRFNLNLRTISHSWKNCCYITHEKVPQRNLF